MLIKQSYLTIIFLSIFIIIFYITIIYPQQQKKKHYIKMIKSLKINDKIIVNGIVGTIIKFINKD